MQLFELMMLLEKHQIIQIYQRTCVLVDRYRGEAHSFDFYEGKYFIRSTVQKIRVVDNILEITI